MHISQNVLKEYKGIKLNLCFFNIYFGNKLVIKDIFQFKKYNIIITPLIFEN